MKITPTIEARSLAADEAQPAPRSRNGNQSNTAVDPNRDWQKWSGAKDVIKARDGQPPSLHTVKEILAAAQRHPFYAGHLVKGAPLEQQPILTKAQLYDRLQDFGKVPRPGTYWSPSGGTGGRSIYFPTDVGENRYARLVLADRLKQAGVFGPDQVCLNVVVTGNLYRTQELFTDFGERCGATMLPAGNDQSPDTLFEIAEHFHVNALCGSPDMMVLLAGALEERGEKLNLDTIITGAATMHDAQRAYIREHTGVKHFAEIFGSAECGVWAYKPPCLEGTRTFVYDPKMVHVEIVDPDQDGYGKVVVTHLIRKANPLVRYDTGDVGRLSPRIIDGRREHTLEFAGRHQRSFQLGNDSYELSDLEARFTTPVLQYQVVLSRDESRWERAELRVVTAKLTPAQERRFKKSVEEVFDFTQIRFVDVDGLHRLPRSRKIPAIVDQRGA